MHSRALAAALVVLLTPAAVWADRLDSLLNKGPVVVVEHDGKGKFASATGVVAVEASIEKAWAVITEFQSYPKFVPKVVKTEVDDLGPTEVKVKWELEVPGPNTVYTVRYKLDPVKRTIEAEQVGGDLKGSRWFWELESAGPNRTLLHYRSSARNFSSILESAEDDQQTITIGVNVGGVLTLLRALQGRIQKT
jgi:ribosome-associated toxin RatA of RatAB toxin-antitoxin module